MGYENSYYCSHESLNNMKLKKKFLSLTFAVATGVIGLGISNIYIYHQQEHLSKTVKQNTEFSLQLNQAKNYQNKIFIEVLKFSNLPQYTDLNQQKIEELTNGLNQSLLKSKRFKLEPIAEQQLYNIEQAVIQFNLSVNQYLADFIYVSSLEQAIAQTNELIEEGHKLTQLIDRAIAYQRIQLNQNQASSKNISSWSLYFNIASLVLGITVVLFMAWLFAKQVASPILKLKNVAVKIGQGEWDTLDIDSTDEIGSLAKAFNQVVEKFKRTNESKRYVDKIIRNINESLIVLDNNYNIKEFNFATLLMLGYEEEEILGKSIKEIFADAKSCYEILGITNTIGNSFLGRKETTLITKEQRKISVSLSASIMWDESDRVEGIVCLVQDISAHKQAMETLRRQALMFETIHDGILLTDLDGYIIDCNPAAERIFGYPKTKLLGQMTGILRYPSDSLTAKGNPAQYLTQQMMDGVLRRGRWAGEFRFIRENGTWGICETVVVPLRDRTNKSIATIGVNRDITERKQAEQALRNSEERLESILNSLNDIVWSMEIESKKILYLNPAIAKVYGRPVEEFFQQPSLWFDVIHPADRQRVMNFSNELFATGERDLEYRIIRPDGEVRWIHDRGKLTGDEKKNTLRFEGIATDITEQKQTQYLHEEAQLQLELRVKERTAELKANNDMLLSEIRDRMAAEAALRESEAKFKQLACQEALVNQLTEQIRNSLDLSTILNTTVKQIRTLLSVDRCVFIWYRQQKNQSCWQVVAEAKHPWLATILGEYQADPSDFLAQKIQNLEILREENLAVSAEPHLQEIYQDWRYQAILALPIQTHTGDIGVVSCGNFRRIKPWSDGDVALLQLITNQLAIALFQAELYAKAQTAAQEAHERAEELKDTLDKLQKTQAQLIQSEKMSSLGQLVAGVAHEINNPVNFISGNINFIQEYTEDLLDLLDLYQTKFSASDSEIIELLEDCDLPFIREDLPNLLSSMKTGANRIGEIVLSLRNFSRLDEANYKSVDLHEGIENSLLLLQHRLHGDADPTNNREIHPEIEVIKDYGDLPQIECFASLLNQVFINILSNAIDALQDYSFVPNNAKTIAHSHQKISPGAIATLGSDNHSLSSTTNGQTIAIQSESKLVKTETTLCQNPKIYISTEQIAGDRVMIRIKDNGMGMDETVCQRIFDPFFTTKPVGSGTGLGLSVSYQIVVQRHHGDLSCISHPGQGTELLIELPIHQ